MAATLNANSSSSSSVTRSRAQSSPALCNERLTVMGVARLAAVVVALLSVSPSSALPLSREGALQHHGTSSCGPAVADPSACASHCRWRVTLGGLRCHHRHLRPMSLTIRRRCQHGCVPAESALCAAASAPPSSPALPPPAALSCDSQPTKTACAAAGAGCVWCLSRAVPDFCATADEAARLPPSVFTCAAALSAHRL